MHLSATKSTMDSTYSSTDSLSSRDFGDSDDRLASGGSASTSASTASHDGASTALSTPVKAAVQNGQGSSSNGAGAYSSSVSHDSTSEFQHTLPMWQWMSVCLLLGVCHTTIFHALWTQEQLVGLHSLWAELVKACPIERTVDFL